MNRTKAIEEIMTPLKRELVVSSVGMISREVYAVRDRPRNFYVMGSMGASLGIGIGLALNTSEQVLVIAGDGEILMSLGTLVLLNKLRLPNLRLVILDNNCYQTTGGQRTCSDAVDFTDICSHHCYVINVECTKRTVGRITIPCEEIAKRFRNVIGSQ